MLHIKLIHGPFYKCFVENFQSDFNQGLSISLNPKKYSDDAYKTKYVFIFHISSHNASLPGEQLFNCEDSGPLATQGPS